MDTPHIIHAHARATRSADLPNEVFHIGVTGGMGSGKSTLARRLQELGAPVIDLDAIAHEVCAAGGAAIAALVCAFGPDILTDDGALNRAHMRSLVFKNPQTKQTLEQILHPIIRQVAIQRSHDAALTEPLFIVYDIPLLAESPEWQNMLDWIVVVDCTRETQIRRIQNRNPQLSLATIEAILNQQASREQRTAIADVIVDNDTDVAIHQENPPNRLHLDTQAHIIVRFIEKW
ncbi:MAG: dephospho-CoA kinase [Formosimonas sp.]|jgi:dephospho-CoA kinase